MEAMVPLTLPEGATVAQAVSASGLCARFALAADAIAFAIHGQRASGDIPLADGDRVEITRPLLADPKQVRRARAAERPLSPTPSRVKKRRAAK
jgi:putative ubiquitin-RnfH superfamily antitoxin RatB of RatAB toxin-antitoxin module